MRAGRAPVLPTSAATPLHEPECWRYFPSKMNCRVSLIALVRCGASPLRPDDFSQACALSRFSNSFRRIAEYKNNFLGRPRAAADEMTAGRLHRRAKSRAVGFKRCAVQDLAFRHKVSWLQHAALARPL